jgi:hypothetical protein
MRIRLAAFLTLFFLVPITSCSTITVRYDYDVEADFAGLKPLTGCLAIALTNVRTVQIRTQTRDYRIEHTLATGLNVRWLAWL